MRPLSPVSSCSSSSASIIPLGGWRERSIMGFGDATVGGPTDSSRFREASVRSTDGRRMIAARRVFAVAIVGIESAIWDDGEILVINNSA